MRNHIITLRTLLRICRARYTLNLPTRAQVRAMAEEDPQAPIWDAYGLRWYTRGLYWYGKDLVYSVTDGDKYEIEVTVKPSGEVSYSR
jgi:hypothetical protein